LGTVVTLTRSLFSEKQQISKGEYKRTQQPTFTRGMGKSDIMHGICGAQNILQKHQYFFAGLFLKNILYFAKRILSKRSRKFFSIITKSPGLNHPGISAVPTGFHFQK
jgi:preprotein translocase subunit SecG